jgi:phosphatidate cytidylyltransferase
VPLYYVFYFISLYFLIGGIGIAVTNRKSDYKAKRDRWIKFLTYYIITHLLMLSIVYTDKVFSYLAMLIVLIGLFEIIKTGRKDTRLLIVASALIICLTAGYGFIKFAVLPMQCLAFVYLLTVVFDGFSQVSGQLFGKHKLAVNISPNKTIEGLAGGLLCTIITACLIKDWVKFSLWQSIYVSASLCLVALCGDLLASTYKRKVGIKDYSNIIPGHGGVLDRFDSLIVTGAGFYVYLMMV